MTIDSWLQTAIADAEKRGLPELKTLLEALAQSTRALRSADFVDNASGTDGQGRPAYSRGADPRVGPPHHGDQ